MPKQSLIDRIYFFLSRKKVFVDFDKEENPTVIYRNGERYEIPALFQGDGVLEINERGIYCPAGYGPGTISHDQVVKDLSEFMQKQGTPILLKGEEWASGIGGVYVSKPDRSPEEKAKLTF